MDNIWGSAHAKCLQMARKELTQFGLVLWYQTSWWKLFTFDVALARPHCCIPPAHVRTGLAVSGGFSGNIGCPHVRLEYGFTLATIRLCSDVGHPHGGTQHSLSQQSDPVVTLGFLMVRLNTSMFAEIIASTSLK